MINREEAESEMLWTNNEFPMNLRAYLQNHAVEVLGEELHRVIPVLAADDCLLRRGSSGAALDRELGPHESAPASPPLSLLGPSNFRPDWEPPDARGTDEVELVGYSGS
jgi:hypothetical protein